MLCSRYVYISDAVVTSFVSVVSVWFGGVFGCLLVSVVCIFLCFFFFFKEEATTRN